MREEWADGHHGFCQKCLKRHELCSATFQMKSCVLLKDHNKGDATIVHYDGERNTWSDPAPYRLPDA